MKLGLSRLIPILSLSFLNACFWPTNTGDNNFSPDTSQQTPGLDVSHFQGANIDWNLVKTSGMKFVYIKATQGTWYLDPSFSTNVTNALDAGLFVGAYHFYDPDVSSFAQAAFFVRNLKGKNLDLPPVVDVELAAKKHPDLELKSVLKFIDKVKVDLGCRVIVYAGKSFYQAHLSKLPNNIPLWIAEYTPLSNIPDVNHDIWFWQHDQTAKINGINGNVDADIFFGTVDDLRRIACQ